MKANELPSKEAKAYAAIVTLSNYCKTHDCGLEECLFCYGDDLSCELMDYSPVKWKSRITKRIENMNAGGV